MTGADTGAVGPVTPSTVRIAGHTPTTVTLEWDPIPQAVGYLPMVDGSPLLADGKRHVSWDGARTSMKIGRPADGKPHEYAIVVLLPDTRSVTL